MSDSPFDPTVLLPDELLDRFRQRAAVHDRDNTFPDDDLADLKAAGYLAILAPKELGGGGLGLAEASALQQRLAGAAPATALSVNMHLVWTGVAKVLADRLTEVDTSAAYHGSKVATRLKVMGVEVASMGLTEPTHEGDEVVQFTEPKKGTYKKLIIRDGRLLGSILLGDISKSAYLMQAFGQNTPLPERECSNA